MGFCSGHGEIPDATAALRRGAVDFLEKPFTRDVFLERVRESLQKDADARNKRIALESTRAKLATLTSRERVVLDLILDGLLTKQIASRLDLSIKTIENHRSNIARKMDVDSAVQLVKLVAEYRALC
ncbi:MAG: LuxR C-terminal-related transcriptional regulator [Pirellulaceae bacterium]